MICVKAGSNARRGCFSVLRKRPVSQLMEILRAQDEIVSVQIDDVLPTSQTPGRSIGPKPRATAREKKRCQPSGAAWSRLCLSHPAPPPRKRNCAAIHRKLLARHGNCGRLPTVFFAGAIVLRIARPSSSRKTSANSSRGLAWGAAAAALSASIRAVYCF
jgi:hypothetical protein